MTKRAVGIELARQRAHRVMRRHPLANIQPVPIEALVEDLGVELIQTRIDGANAQLVVGTHSTHILIADRLTDSADRRWSIAHELGHLFLDHPTPPAAELCSPQPCPQTPKQRDVEAESNAFASALLIHAPASSRTCDSSPMTLDAPAELARQCGVPLTAAAIRITEDSSRSCAAVLSERGRVRWISPSWRFLMRYGAGLVAGQPVPASSIARRYFDGGALAESAQIMPPGAWIDRPRWVLVFEHSMAASEPDTVLTMLWCLDELTTAPDRWRNVRAPTFVRDCMLGRMQAEAASRCTLRIAIDVATQEPALRESIGFLATDGTFARPGYLRLPSLPWWESPVGSAIDPAAGRARKRTDRTARELPYLAGYRGLLAAR